MDNEPLVPYNLGVTQETVAKLDFIQEVLGLPDHGAVLMACVEITHTMLSGQGTVKRLPAEQAQELLTFEAPAC